MSETETETVDLYGWVRFDDPGAADTIRAALFGAMLDRAGVVERYRSDLYRDALWVNQYVTGPITFYFVVRQWGTHIGTDADCMRATHTAMGGTLYRVELLDDGDRHTSADGRSRWFARFTLLASGGAR
jgi:hypothetical protein